MENEYAVPFLLIPSMSNHDEFVTIINVDFDEANIFLEMFNERVETERRIKYVDSTNTELFEEFSMDLKELWEDEKLSALIDAVSISRIPGARGRRAVFIDVENDYMFVGRTVVYNRNWAAMDVTDTSLLKTILDALQ